MLDRYKILDVNVSAVNLKKACEYLDECIQEKKNGYVCIVPVSTIMSCQEDQEYKDIINNSSMNTPDGMPVVWLGQMMGHKEVQRTYGPDLMLQLCDFGQARGYKHYFYGGSEESCEKLAVNLKGKFPNINIVGKYSPPFRPLTEEESQKLIEEVNAADPDIIWVGLGSPKQDFWMREYRDKLKAPVMIGVGAAFDFLSGIKPQAPRWIRHSGLEWLFRLCCEPRRLWKRYLFGNTKFIYLITRDYIQQRLHRRHEIVR